MRYMIINTNMLYKMTINNKQQYINDKKKSK